VRLNVVSLFLVLELLFLRHGPASFRAGTSTA